MKYKPEVVNIALHREDAELVKTILDWFTRKPSVVSRDLPLTRNRVINISKRIDSALRVNVFTYYK
jgi:hypothetical protein